MSNFFPRFWTIKEIEKRCLKNKIRICRIDQENKCFDIFLNSKRIKIKKDEYQGI